VDCCDEREAKKDEREGSKEMSKKTKPNPTPKQEGRSPKVVATYFLAKHSGLFQPGQPFILSHTLSSAKTGKTKTLSMDNIRYPRGKSQGGGGSGGGALPVIISNPAFRSLTSTTYAVRSSTAVTVPAGVVDGDILIAMFVANRIAASTTLNAPAGWTLIDSSRVKDSTGLTCDAAIYWKRALGETGSYTFTNTSASTQLVVLAYSDNVAAGSPIASSSKNFTTDPTSSGVTASAFAVTTPANNAYVIYLSHNWVNSGALVPPTGMTERFDSFIYVSDQLVVTAGSIGPFFQVSGNAAAQPWAAYVVALKPA
jgi:hypothetical protein